MEERAEIVVVTGLPRSGTSLMMSMLRAGGAEVLTDGVRGPDVDNPGGYFELERVKRLATDSAWLDSARGKAVKVISALLEHLPDAYRYKVLFMRRNLDEVLESQARMLAHRGAPHDREGELALRAELTAHLALTARWLRERSAFEVHDVSYAELLDAPDATIERVVAFLGWELDRVRMRDSIDPSLRRSRRASEIP